MAWLAPTMEKDDSLGPLSFVHPSFFQAVVLLENLAQTVVWQSDYCQVIGASHGFGGDHGIDNRFLGGLNRCQKEGIQLFVRQHLQVVYTFCASRPRIRG